MFHLSALLGLFTKTGSEDATIDAAERFVAALRPPIAPAALEALAQVTLNLSLCLKLSHEDICTMDVVPHRLSMLTTARLNLRKIMALQINDAASPAQREDRKHMRFAATYFHTLIEMRTLAFNGPKSNRPRAEAIADDLSAKLRSKFGGVVEAR